MSFPETWLRTELSNLLGFETNEIVEYLRSLDDYEAQKDYLMEMLDTEDKNHRNFIEQFYKKTRSTAKIAALAPPGMVAYIKKSEDDLPAPVQQSTRPKTKQKTKENKENEKTGRFVPLFSKDGKMDDTVMMLPGRNKCECQAQKHDLINNCIKCGRIVCSQEGSGPCLFCGQLVCTREEKEVLNRGSRKSEQLMKKLMTTSNAQEKAEFHKNTLLEYDRTSEKRTQVIDDESDYFSVDNDKWLNKEQRQKLKERQKELHEQRHGSRLNQKFTFDFAGRKVIEDNFAVSTYDPSQDQIVKDILEAKKGTCLGNPNLKNSQTAKMDLDSFVANPSVPRPTFVSGSEMTRKNLNLMDDGQIGKHLLRIQDAQLQEMRDDGWCLSMHQPWASYLIMGIKVHEGRNWYSPHRGRLWIHAASKVPSDEEIASVQQIYINRSKLMDNKIEFPKNLPVSCLLGCVDVTDVLAQEEYRDRYPKGESNSPFVFVCQNPQELMIKFPMTGQHKIYKLDSNIHTAAKRSAKKLHDQLP